MTCWIVSRHPGAIEWLRRHHPVDNARTVDHLDPEWVLPGDHVIGTLPIQLVATVCERGGLYQHLCVPMTRMQRGQELGADMLEALGATLECFEAQHLSCTNTDQHDL